MRLEIVNESVLTNWTEVSSHEVDGLIWANHSAPLCGIPFQCWIKELIIISALSVIIKIYIPRFEHLLCGHISILLSQLFLPITWSLAIVFIATTFFFGNVWIFIENFLNLFVISYAWVILNHEIQTLLCCF